MPKTWEKDGDGDVYLAISKYTECRVCLSIDELGTVVISDDSHTAFHVCRSCLEEAIQVLQKGPAEPELVFYDCPGVGQPVLCPWCNPSKVEVLMCRCGSKDAEAESDRVH